MTYLIGLTIAAAVAWGFWKITRYFWLKRYYRFKGVSSHAAFTPELGRSALDALELMNVGVNFLREHVPQDVRLHYAITNAGGRSPNVVQAESEEYFCMRSPKSVLKQSTPMSSKCLSFA